MPTNVDPTRTALAPEGSSENAVTARRSGEAPSRFLRWLDDHSGVLIASAVAALIAGYFGNKSIEIQTSARFVEIAAGILSERAEPEAEGIRRWATLILDKHSGIPFTSDTRQALIDSIRLHTPSMQTGIGVDLKIDGFDGQISLRGRNSFVYSWEAVGATACMLTAPETSGIDLSGTGTINRGHKWFPKAGQPVIFTILCTDGTNNVADTMTITE